MIKKINNYEILSKIASGGMANVCLALDTRTGIKVAIKILKDEVSDKEKIYERFSQEGLLNLNHPNIVKILDAGVYENTPYIVMENIEGRDLEDLIKSRNKLSVNEALSIFTQLLSALSYVHSQGIIHRDIKPKNILIDKSGTAKLTDFGIAKSIYSHVKTSTGGYLGAPAYSSPEQMDGLAIDNRSDIYSLGITLYEMLAGVTPFGSTTSIEEIIKKKFMDSLPSITNYRKDIPQYLIAIISKCIEKIPGNRFENIDELINNLKNKEVRIDSFGKTIIKTDKNNNETKNNEAVNAKPFIKNKKIIILVSVLIFALLFSSIFTSVYFVYKNKRIAEEKRVAEVALKNQQDEQKQKELQAQQQAAAEKQKKIDDYNERLADYGDFLDGLIKLEDKYTSEIDDLRNKFNSEKNNMTLKKSYSDKASEIMNEWINDFSKLKVPFFLNEYFNLQLDYLSAYKLTWDSFMDSSLDWDKLQNDSQSADIKAGKAFERVIQDFNDEASLLGQAIPYPGFNNN